MNGADVTVNINSPGGDMFEGLAIYNLLRDYEGKVTVKVLGIAASAASIIAMAGDDIQIGRGAFLMIHNCWVYAMGNRHDFAELANSLGPFDSAMADIYAVRSGLDMETVQKLMDAESYIGGSDAINSVIDNNDGTFSIAGAWNDPDKYSRIDTGAIIDQRPVSVIPPGNQSPPANIVISSFSVVQQNISVETMRASWDQAQNAIAYEAQWRRNDGNWVNVPRSSTTSFDVPGIYAGRYLVRVRAINASEISSGWGYSEEATLTGKVGNPPKPVGFATTPINWGIRLNWGFPANTSDTLKTEIQYTANSDFSNPLLLSDVPYPSAEYIQLGLKAGQEFWYRAQLVDRTGNESGWTDWVRGESNANADDYLGDIADDFLTSADGDRLTGDIDTNLEGILQNALANHGTVEHQFAQFGEVRADILVVKTTIADVNQAMAEMSTQVQAQIEDVTASLEDKLTATVDASGATAIHTLKAGVRINDIFYSAGMSIAVLAEAGKPVVTRVGFNANQFVLMSGSGDTQYSPFAVVNGQVFISDAFIQYGQITLAKIGELRSANYVQGKTGTIMKSDGSFEVNGAVAGEGASRMSNLNYSVKDGNGVLRVQLGKITGVF
nr:head maturation protease, ClpP-related [Citrobacter sp. wls829]